MTTARNEFGITDTLFTAVTDSTGHFEGIATFTESDIYPMLVSRSSNVLGIINMVFADGDTIQIAGQIPNITESVTIDSRENEVYKTFERVDSSFDRVVNFINAGYFSADSVGIEVEKWSDIYWEVFETYPEMYAGKLAAENSISLLRTWNDTLMVSRADEIMADLGRILPSTLHTVIEYQAEVGGLENAVAKLDEYRKLTNRRSQLLDIDVQKIELLFDSSRTMEANRFLDQFKSEYSDNPMAMEWAENITYDLEFLAPGNPFPNFDFITISGDTLSNSSLQGKPYLIEITRFDNFLYQQQFDRTVSIYQIYQNFDLEIVTVPVATTDVTLQAFFSERSLLWNVVQPNSFDAEEIVALLNINRLPTRFLIDRDGNIIRRYIGNEYDDVVRGLQQITN
tara:strand:+ start:69782 stop:70975 length:1194 start_codon:yes stop_codon:yes gene_type:complete